MEEFSWPVDGWDRSVASLGAGAVPLGGLNAGFEDTNQFVTFAERECEMTITAQPLLAVN